MRPNILWGVEKYNVIENYLGRYLELNGLAAVNKEALEDVITSYKKEWSMPGRQAIVKADPIDIWSALRPDALDINQREIDRLIREQLNK